jgi:hypothetical protein
LHLSGKTERIDELLQLVIKIVEEGLLWTKKQITMSIIVKG